MSKKFTLSDLLSRRAFLVGGGASLAIPFLPSVMSPRRGRAAGMGCPKRFLFLFTGNGQQEVNWLPQGRADWNMTNESEHVREIDLTAETGAISRVLGDSFSQHRSKLLLLRGLDHIAYNNGGHVVPSPISGWARQPAQSNYKTGETIDQILARSASVYSSEPAARSIHMNCKPVSSSPTSVSQSLVAGNIQSVPHLESVEALYDQLFADFVAPDPGMPMTGPDPEVLARQGLRVRTVDRIRGQYQALLGHSRLSNEDKMRLSAHVEHLDSVEARLSALSIDPISPPVSCMKPPRPTDLGRQDENDLVATTRNAIDTIVAGFRCDRTRVATLMLSNGTDIRNSAYLPGGPTSKDHHILSHDAAFSEAPREELARINHWYGDQVAYLLSQLDQVEDPETGATYLDNTLVYWGNEDGCNTRGVHWGTNQPVLLAGGLGTLRMGRYIDYRKVTGADGAEVGAPLLFDYQGQQAELEVFRGRLYNSLLISILESFGVPSDAYGEAGQNGIGDYEDNYADQYSIAEGRRALPNLI